jgi:acyl carrier protein
MGLDIAELLLEIEENFSINILEEDMVNKSQHESVIEYDDRFTVKFLCDLIERRIQKKNEGINSFPNLFPEINNSVHETLSKQFNISDHNQIVNESSLEQLANLSASPLPAGFWRRFRKIQKDDEDELKSIKSYIVSREYISTVDIGCLSFCISIVLLGFLCFFELLLFMDGKLSRFAWRSFLVILFAPSCILFGIRAIVNWVRCGRKSQITVAEIVNHIVDKKRDHSVRIDGSPYSREEIEQGVIELISKHTSVKQKDITMDCCIIKDLGLG